MTPVGFSMRQLAACRPAAPLSRGACTGHPPAARWKRHHQSLWPAVCPAAACRGVPALLARPQNITIGPLVVDALRPVTDKPLDCHLMIVEPELRVADFAKVRAEGVVRCWMPQPVGMAAPAELRLSAAVSRLVAILSTRPRQPKRLRLCSAGGAWLRPPGTHGTRVSPKRASLTEMGPYPSPVQAGADIISVHAEQSATIHLDRIVNQV